MNNDASRYIRVGEWIFEVKAVRAIRTEEFGKPYNATSHISLNGSDMFVDSQLVKDGSNFTREDYVTFIKFGQLMGVEEAHYDRYVKGKRVARTVKIEQQENTSSEGLMENVHTLDKVAFT